MNPPANTYAGIYDIRERTTALLPIEGVVLLGVVITMLLVAVTERRRITGKHITIQPLIILYTIGELTKASLPLPLAHISVYRIQYVQVPSHWFTKSYSQAIDQSLDFKLFKTLCSM